MKVLSIGEIIWDVYPDKRCIGGAPFNFAAHSALLGCQSYLLSAVGDDELAEPALKEADAFGIKPNLIKRVSQKVNGTIDIIKKNTSVPASVVYFRKESKAYFSLRY